MTIWNDIVAGISLLLLLFLVWGELRRADRRMRVARVIASGLAVIALACLGLSLTYMRRGVNTGQKDRPLMAGTDRSGIVSVDWTRKIVKGDRVRVTGRWLRRTGKGGRKAKIILTGMGSTVDSAELSRGVGDSAELLRGAGDGAMVAAAEFSLSTLPAVIGRTVYHLMVMSGADTLERAEIPVEVVAGKALKILFLASSPDFENRFLIGWLSKGGHGVASRTRVSREKYDKIYIRLPELSLETLTPGLLDRFDLVIADAAELSLIGAGQRSVLRREVREKGMGLIVKTDSAEGRQRSDGETRDGAEGFELDGAGKLYYTAVDTTYTQVLSGMGRPYAAYWSGVLGKTAREAAPEDTWSTAPGLPRVGEPVRVWLQTGKDGLPQGELGGVDWAAAGGRSVYLAQDAQLPFYWQGVYWPEAAGWQYARSLEGDSCWWYVWPVGAWSGAGAKGLADGSAGVEGWERVAAPKGWFYVVFFICVLFLWVERKWEG
jgi:hypothetical protein